MDYADRMKTITASEAKANLSRWLRVVGRGQAILISVRGRPVARLVPVDAADAGSDEERLVRLEKAGIIRRAKKTMDLAFLDIPVQRLNDSESLLSALLEEREEGP